MSSAVPGSEKSFLRRVAIATQPVLTKVAHGSAPFITTFALIHLTAPVMANIGGTSLASQVMVRNFMMSGEFIRGRWSCVSESERLYLHFLRDCYINGPNIVRATQTC